MFSPQNHYRKKVFPMNSITQDIIFKQSVVEYSLKHGVTEAAKRYKQYIDG